MKLSKSMEALVKAQGPETQEFLKNRADRLDTLIGNLIKDSVYGDGWELAQELSGTGWEIDAVESYYPYDEKLNSLGWFRAPDGQWQPPGGWDEFNYDEFPTTPDAETIIDALDIDVGLEDSMSAWIVDSQLAWYLEQFGGKVFEGPGIYIYGSPVDSGEASDLVADPLIRATAIWLLFQYRKI